MEVKINREIRNYTESIFFGLSLRQFIFSILACIVAVILYFVFKPFFGLETLSWMCILGAAPFAVLGFVKYNGMTAEEFLGIKEYIKQTLKLDRRNDLKGNSYLVLTLEGEVISMLPEQENPSNEYV